MSEAGGDDKKFTQAELDEAVAERNKALEKKRDEILDELKDVRAKLKAYDGVDPSEHKKLAARVQELEQQRKADAAGITSEQLQKMRQEVEADLVKRFTAMSVAELAERLPAVREIHSDNRSLRLDSVVKADMAKAGVRSERIDALYRLAADRFDLTDDGKPMLKQSPGMEIGRYVSEDLKKEFPEFFNGSGSSGGGASKSAGSAGGGDIIPADFGDGSAFLANVGDLASGKKAVATP